MPNNYLSPFSLDDAPRAQDLGALRRSQQLNGGVRAETPTTSDPDEGNWGAETARSVAANVGNNYTNLLPALYKGVTGDMEGMRESARAYQAENENAKRLGPAVQDFDGEQGVGHNLQALAYQGANMLPDMVGGLGAGAIAGGMARRFARKAIVKSVMRNELAATAEQIAAKRAAADAAGAAARTQAVAEAGSTPAAVSARVRGAMASSDDAFKAASMKDALAFAGRTPSRVAQLDRATAVGSGVGAGLSQVAGLNTTNAERLASEDTDQGDAQALLAGTGVAAAISFVPVNRLLSRFGPAATAEVAQMGERFLPRVMREYAAQGLHEGVTEATQQAAQLASHAWIDKNWDTLVGSDARNEILMSGVLGGVMGGAFGAAGEVGRSGVDAVGSGARAAANVAGQAKAKILESIAKVAETRRQAFKDRPAAGEPMEGEASEPSTFSKFMKGAGEMATDAKDLLVAKTQIAAHKFGVQLDALEEGDAMESEAQQRADALQAKLDEAEQTGSLKIPGDSYPYVAYPDLDKRQNLLLSYVHPAVREDAGVRSMLAGSLDAMLRGKPLDAAEEASLADLVESGAMNQLTLDFLRVKGPEIGALFDQVEQGRKYSDDTDAEYGDVVAMDAGDAGGYQQTADGAVEVDANNTGEQQAALLAAGVDASEAGAKIDETDFNSGINTTGGERAQGPDERMESARATITAAKKALANYAPMNPEQRDPRHIAELQATIKQATADGQTARVELQQSVLGRPIAPPKLKNGQVSQFGKPFGAFVFDKNPDAPAPFEKAKKDPSYVALVNQVNASSNPDAPVMRDALLNIAQATQSMASSMPGDATMSEQQKYRDAFFKVLQHAVLSGVEINYATMTPGPVVYTGRKGTAPTTLFTLTDADIKDLRTANTKAGRAAKADHIAQIRAAKVEAERDTGKGRYKFVIAKKLRAHENNVRKMTREVLAEAKKADKPMRLADARREAMRRASTQLQRDLIEGKDAYVAAKQDENLRAAAAFARNDPSLLDEWLAQYAKAPHAKGDPSAGEWKAAIEKDSDHIEAFAERMIGIWRANAQRGDDAVFDERFDTPFMERPTQLNVPYEAPRGEVARSKNSRKFEFTPTTGVASDVNTKDNSKAFTEAYKKAENDWMAARSSERNLFDAIDATPEGQALRAARKQHGPVILQLQKYGMRIKKAEAEAAAGAKATHAQLVKLADATEDQVYATTFERMREETGANAAGALIDKLYDNPGTFAALEAYQQLKRERVDALEYGDTTEIDNDIRAFMATKQGGLVKDVSAAYKRYNQKVNEAASGAREVAEAARVRAMDGIKRQRTQAMLDKAVVNAYDTMSTFLGRKDTREAMAAFEAANAAYEAKLQSLMKAGPKPTPEAVGRAMWTADINAQRKAGAISETVHQLMLKRAADETVALPERFRAAEEGEGKASLIEAREDVLKPLSYSRATLDPAARALLRDAGARSSKLLAGDPTVRKIDAREPSDYELAAAVLSMITDPVLAPDSGTDFIATVRQLTDGWPEDNRVVEALNTYDALRGGREMRNIESAREAAAAKAAAAVDMSEPKPEPKTKAEKAAAEREKAERAKARLAEKEKANARLAAFNERADAEIAKALKLNTVRDNDVVAPKVRAQFAVVKPQPKVGEKVQYDELDVKVTADMIRLPSPLAKNEDFPRGRAERAAALYIMLAKPNGAERGVADAGWVTDPLRAAMQAELEAGKHGGLRNGGHHNDAMMRSFAERYDALLKQSYADSVNAERAANPNVQKDELTAPINVWYGTRENAQFSNLAARPFEFKGLKFFSVEHAYQTLKGGVVDRATYERYTGGGQKIIGRHRAKTENEFNLRLMRALVKASFEQNPSARAALLATGAASFTHVQDRGVWATEFPRALVAAREALRTAQNDELADAAQAAPSEHDNTKYQAMANATLEAAGVKHSVKVVSGDVNSYNKSTKTITLRDDLKGGERVEVLMHEVGHHILWNEIAKHVEGGWGAVKRDMSLAEGIELLQHGNPKLHRALMKDFNAWRSTHRKYAGKTDLDIRASRAPMLRSQRAERYSAAGKGRRATRADFTGADVFHEWVADQIARALTTQNKPRSIVESFFADIAKALRAAWDALTGGQRNKYAPYDSVDNWVAGMFDPARAEASDQVGETATEGQTETALRAAFADAYDVDDAESMKAYIKDVLRPEERLILEQALSTPVARRILAEAYAKNKTEREALGDAEQGLENRIALAYPLWKSGAFKVGPKGSSAFNGLTDNLLAMMDVAGGSSMAERIFTDIASGKIERVRRAGHKYDVRQVEARARGKRQQAFNKVSAAIDKVMRPIDKFWTSVGARLEATGVPALRELRSVLVRPQGATGDYDRGVTPAIQHSTGRWMQRAQHILEGLSDKERITTIDAMQRKLDGEVLSKKSKEVQRAVKQLRKFFDDFHTYAVEAGIFQENQKRENHFPVVMDLHDDYAVQKLTEVYSDPRFEAAIRNLSFFREAEGKGPASSEAKAKPAKPAAPLKTEAQLASADARRKYMKHIADKQHEWPAAVHAVNSSLVDAIEAAPSLRSLEGMLKKSQEREIKWQDNGAVVHAIGYEQRYIKARMKEFGGATAPKAQTKVEALEAAGNNAPLVPSTRPIADLVKELVARTTNESRQTERVFDPVDKKAKGERSQLSSFVYELGDAAIIKKFASVQSKDMAGIMAGYIEPMVRRAEAARYFGAKREKLDALLERARHEGATDTDIDLAEDSVKAALGTYGADGSPTIAALSPSLAAKLHGDKARAFMEGAQAYQNARLLPLSLLSSLVDPLGIAVRTGGDMSLAYDSWKEGMRSLRDVATRKELQGMLEQIGSADDMPAIAFTAGFGSHKDSLAHKVNETVFKWNGMSTWVRTTRYMAVVAAHGFLLKHGRGESEQSRRYLAELNLQPREIPRDPNNKHRVELLTPSEYKRASGDRKDLDDRLKSALQEFVDNAVLRPNSTQQPLWYSDPYMGLITQYKAFGYAIFNQIGGRIAHEWKHGNHRVLLAAMAYVPVGMMAELLREFIQYGFDGHPKRAEWGATDYALLATQRSGLFGPQTATLTDIAGDFQYRRTPGASLTGPVIGQATNFMDGKDTAGDFESALPASPLWKNHINPLGGGEPATPGTAKPAHQPLEARV